MSYSCTLSLLLPAHRFGALLEELEVWMPAADLQQLLEMRSQPLAGQQHERCLNFRLPPDLLPPDLLECCGPADGHALLSIGCIWTRLSLQGDQLGLHFTPATSTLAHFFSEAPLIRGILSGIATSCDAQLLHLDEWGDECCWWPLPG